MFYSNQPEQILATQNQRKYLRYTYEKRGGTLFLFANDMIIYRETSRESIEKSTKS